MKYIFVFLIFELLLNWTTAVLKYECPKSCECETKDNNEQFINCRKDASNLKIEVSEKTFKGYDWFEPTVTGNEITINCTTFDQFIYELAPQLNVTNLVSIVYNNCPLPTDGSLTLEFSNLHILQFVSERPIKYETFTNHHFGGLGTLYELRLISNSTFHLADNAFVDIAKLKVLYLHSNEVNFKVFNSLTKIDKIELGNLNGDFDLDGLKSCEKLEQVNLANMNIPRLSKRIFENVPSSLRFVMVYDNNIGTIDPNVFESVENLFLVRFTGNVIETFPSHFIITSDDFRYFQLTGNHESLPDELLSNLPKLRDVDIHCNLKFVPENLFKGSIQLNIVNLTGNQLTDLPENLLANQTKLFHLYLNENRFVDVLPGNLITNLLTKPTWVSITGFIFSFKSNRIKSISQSDLELLVQRDAEIDFSDNLITDLSAFNNLKTNIAVSATNRPSLFFNFNGNPIVCDCGKIKTFRRYLKNRWNTYNNYNSNSLKCVSPSALANTAVIDVQCDDEEEKNVAEN